MIMCRFTTIASLSSLFDVLCEVISLDCDEIVTAPAQLFAEDKDDLDITPCVELVQFAALFTHFPEDDKIGKEHFHYKFSR